jgi:hypothetical protein
MSITGPITDQRLGPLPGGLFAVQMSFWRADRYGRRLEQVHSTIPVQGTVEYNEDTQLKRTLSVQVCNSCFGAFTPWRDWIVPVVTLSDSSGWVETRPKGHFLVTPATTELTPARQVATIEAQDVCILLANWTFAGITPIPAGTNCGTAAREIALGAGLLPAQLNLPDTPMALAEDYTINPGDTALHHINELYNRASFYTVWSDDNGVIRTMPYQLLAEATPALRLSTHEGRARIVPPIRSEPEWGRLRNRVTVRNISPDREPIFSTATVTNPEHPLYHDPNDPETFPLVLGGETVDDSQIETVEQARARAEMLLDEGASFYHRLTVQSVLDLGCDAHQVVELDLMHEQERYGGRWFRRTWSLQLAGARGIITSELNRVEAWK